MPLLGFVTKQERTQEQHDAHARHEASMVRFALPTPTLAKGDKVCLYDAWKHPAVVADVGFVFPRFHQTTGSCFPAGTPVRMADGSEKPIEEVRSGDCVISHLGQSRKVTQTMRRNYSGDTYTLHVSGFPFPLTMTADHEVPVSQEWGVVWKRADELAEGDKVILGWPQKESEPTSLDAAEMLGERVVVLDELMKEDAFTKGNEPDVPNSNLASARWIVKKSGIDWHGRVRLWRSRAESSIFRFVPVCPSLARLVGLFLAEGSNHEGRVSFSLHAKETDLAGEILALVRGLFGVEGKDIQLPSRPNNRTVRFQNQNLAAFFKVLVPGNVYSKRVPAIFMGANEETKLALLLGWMAGDGYVGIRGGKTLGNVRITGVTCSPGLARDVTTLALSCGVRATCGKRKARGRTKVSYGVDLSGRKAVSLFPSVAHRATSREYAKEDVSQLAHGYARPIRSIGVSPVEMLPVFDFEVEEDHSFIAGGIAVHNCVGTGGGQALFTLIAVQRLLATNPTKAFIPWWPFDYGRCRFNEGDRGQGEGALGSSFADTVVKEGVISAAEAGLPAFDTSDGLTLPSRTEMQWSDGNSSLVTKWLPTAKVHPVGTAASCQSVADVKAALLNGYPITFACNNYIGHASVQGSGADACVVGYWDGRGGHQQSLHAVWEHPSLGTLYWAQNNWPGSTYPKDPAGGPICGCWVTEAHVESALRNLSAEVYALSHLNWFPAQNLLDWLI